MKKHLTLCCLFLLLFIWSGCRKEMLDFSRLNGIQASGEWGIPVLNTTYTIEDILAQLENNDYIFQNADGQLFLNYSFDETKIVTDSILLSFSDASVEHEWKTTIFGSVGESFTRDTLFSLKIPDNQVIIKRGVVMHGYFDLNISGNTSSIIVSCQSIRDASGMAFRRNITGNFQERIDLSGYNFHFSYDNVNEIMLDVHFTFQGIGDTKDYFLNFDMAIQNLRLREVTGKVKSYTGKYSDALNIGNIFDKNCYGGSLTLYNPKVTLHIKNSFSWIRGIAIIDKLHFTGQNISSDILTTYPSLIQVLEGMNAEQGIEGLSSVYYSSDFNKLNFAGSVTANPEGVDAGELSILENSALAVKANIGIPFDIRSDNLYYQDTINFNIGDSVNMGKVIQNIVFRYVIGNALPFNVNAQVYFYNSKQQTLVDSLFHPHLQLAGAFREERMVETASILEIEQNRITKVLSADKIIFRLKINADGHRVSVNAKHGIKATLGVKIKYGTDDFFSILQ